MTVSHAPSRFASTPFDLFAHLHEQAAKILGETCGFFVVTCDPLRDRVRLAYLSLHGRVQMRSLYCTIAECDPVRERRPLINDAFCRSISDDVVNSISVPMIRDGVVVGAFGALSNEERAYDERDASALSAIAELGALALENMHFVLRLEKARREAERLEEIGRAMTSSLSLADVLRTVVDAAVELSEADAAVVWLLRDNGEMEAAMTAGDSAPERGMIVPTPPVLQRLRPGEHRVFVYEDVKSGVQEPPALLRHLSAARSTLAVPLLTTDGVLGALSLGHVERRRYSADDIRLVERLSYQASIAVANARLHEQIIGLSLTDPLTGLPNRRHLEMVLEKEFAAARRGRKLAVILFDLDNFKLYNDRAGHQAGDEALRAFADVLRRETRAMNLAARYGGDEFIAVLAEVDRAGAIVHAERVAAAVAHTPLLAEANITASAGIGAYHQGMQHPAELIRAADADLYARKPLRPPRD